jgi:hypothetical protein
MKKTFLAMLLAGGTMTMFAQNTQTGTTGNQTGTTTGSPNTTQQSAGVTGDPTTTTGEHVSNMNNSAMAGQNNTGTLNNGSNINTWNGVTINSTSWTPDSDPSWGWNNYGVWGGSANLNANANNPSGVSGSVSMDNNMNTDASMSSTGAYSAYGTAVPYLPANIQTRFSQDFPAGVNNQYSWNQYGDWYHTHHMSNGRLTQYFYDARGNGYSLALPKLHSYVPENIIASALNKYGSNLYSIAMVKTNTGNDTYMIGLLNRGQLSMHYLDESGATVSDVWRTEDYGTMQSTQSNAAMDGQQSDMNNQATQGTQGAVVNPGTVNNAADTQMPDQSDIENTQTSDLGTEQSAEGTKSKMKIEHPDGSETKIKTKDGKTKVKTKNATNKNINDQNQ